jgi:hypothetical protein
MEFYKFPPRPTLGIGIHAIQAGKNDLKVIDEMSCSYELNTVGSKVNL